MAPWLHLKGGVIDAVGVLQVVARQDRMGIGLLADHQVNYLHIRGEGPDLEVVDVLDTGHLPEVTDDLVWIQAFWSRSDEDAQGMAPKTPGTGA